MNEATILTPDNPAADHHDYTLPGGVVIKFQKGAMALGRNGCTTGELLDVLIHHIEGFQQGKFACPENAAVLDGLRLAKDYAELRAHRRTAQGVKGRDARHVTP